MKICFPKIRFFFIKILPHTAYKVQKEKIGSLYQINFGK